MLFLAVFARSAQASALTYPGVCPSTLNHNAAGGAGVGNAGDCNLLIVFNADGSIGTSGPGGTYESVEDAVIGIVNNSGHTITSFQLTAPGTGIFGFDGDGIDLYVGANSLDPNRSIAANSSDTSNGGYGGPLVFYTGINGAQDTGTINIIGGLASGAGATNCPQFTPNSNPGTCNATYFSLELPASLTAAPRVTQAPEPASLVLVGTGVLGAIRRLRRNRK